MDIAQLATAVAIALAPYTPYLLETAKIVGKKLAETMAAKGGEAAWESARALWDKLQSHLPNDPLVKGAALMVSSDPESQPLQMQFAKVLATRLEQDPNLATELLNLIGGQAGVQAVIAERGSLVEDVIQDMHGAGKQIVRASDNSTIGVIRQKAD